ncbi:MAG: hypothetical protein ACERKD_04705 [Prolixibacteraceae bacterium]
MANKGILTFLPLLVWLLLFASCAQPRHKVNEVIIAQVGNKTLLKSQLIKVIPSNFSEKNDSIEFVKEYTNKWIKQQLLVEEAEKSLSNDELNIAQELEDYRQQLIIHKFKNKKFDQRAESNLADAEIQNYYENNSRLFVLDYPIVQVNYVVFPIEIDLPARFRNLLSSTKEADIIECEDIIFKFATKYDDFNNEWIYFQQFKELGKLNITNDEVFLKKNQIIEFQTENELHIIYVKAFMLPGEQAPLDFVKIRISSLISNQKKIDFLRLFKDSLYNAALKYNKFRVFNQ